MTFCCQNFTTMEYVELLLTGLKTTCMIAPSLLPLTILNRAMKRWVHSYFYFILMTCQTALRNYHLEFFAKQTQMCFTQVISYNILKHCHE